MGDSSAIKRASTTTKLGREHDFSATDRLELDRIVTHNADLLRREPLGSRDTTPYMESIFDHFRNEWKQDPDEKWTKQSLRRILSNRAFALNKDDSLKPVPSVKSSAESRSSHQTPSKEVSQAPAPRRKAVPAPRPMTSTETSVHDHQPLIKTESPLDPPDKDVWSSCAGRKRKRESETSITTTSSSPTLRGIGSVNLQDVILVVQPGPNDPWQRKFLSFPLWRCLPPIDGKDAPSYELNDWSDLSFVDFLRQLRNESITSTDEVIQWGDYSQVVTSNMTFASAVQEQLQNARAQGDFVPEVVFTVVPRR